MAARVSIPTAQHRHQNQGQDSISSSSSLYSSSSTSAIYVPPLSQFDALLQDVTRDWASIREPLVVHKARLSRLQLSTIAIVRALHGNASADLYSSAAATAHTSSTSDSNCVKDGDNAQKRRTDRRQRRALAHKMAAQSRLLALEPSLTALRYEMDHLGAASQAMLRAAELVGQELDYAADHLYGLKEDGPCTKKSSGSIGSSSKSGFCLDLPMTNFGGACPIDSDPASEPESDSDSGNAETYRRPSEEGRSLSRFNSVDGIVEEGSSDEEPWDLRGDSSSHRGLDEDDNLRSDLQEDRGRCDDDDGDDDHDDEREEGRGGDEWLMPRDEPGLSSITRRTKTRDYFVSCENALDEAA